MNELQVFNNPEFGNVRVIEIDGNPWFVGADVAAALGYTNPHKAVRDHVDIDDVQSSIPLVDLNLSSSSTNRDSIL